MHPTKLLSTFALPTLALGITLGIVTSQKPPVAPAVSADSQALPPPQAQRRVLNLVIRRNYDEVDDATRAALDDELRALTKEETRLYLDLSFVIQKTGAWGDNGANGGSIVPMSRYRYVLSLIERALYSDTTTEQLRAEMASLSDDEHSLYLKLSDAIQQVVSSSHAAAYLPADFIATRNAILCVIEREGVSFIDIQESDDQIKAALAECYSQAQRATPPAPASEER